MIGRAMLSEVRSSSFPETVGSTSRRQPGGIAEIPEVISETSSGERITLRGHQKRKVIARRHGVDRLLQSRRDFNVERNASLLPAHRHHALADVLAAHANDVTFGLTGLQKQLVSKSRPRADSMVGFKLFALGNFPGVMADRLHLRELDAGERIDLDHVQCQTVIQESAESLLEITLRSGSLAVEDVLERSLVHQR